MPIGGVSSNSIDAVAVSRVNRAQARPEASPHPRQGNLADLAEEASVMVSQSRIRRLDRTSGNGSVGVFAPISLEDDLADVQHAQEEAAMGRRSRTPQEEEAEKAEIHDYRVHRDPGTDKEEIYYDLLPDTRNPEAKAALEVVAEELAHHLHELGHDGSFEDVLAFLTRRLSQVLPGCAGGGREPDPPVLYAALLYIEERLCKRLEGGAIVLERIRTTIETMLLRYQSELRIGLVIADATYQFFAEKLGSAIQARSMYRHEVLEHSGILKTFSSIIDRFDVARFGPAISFLLDASADDLASTSAAVDRERLKVVRDDIYELATLNTVMRQGELMIERTRQRHSGSLTEDASIANIMKFTLKLAENPLSELASSVTGFARSCVPEPISVHCAFLQMLRSIALMMPDKIFEQEAERRGFDIKGMNPKEHVIEMFDEAMEEAFEQEQLFNDLEEEDDEEEDSVACQDDRL